MTGGALRAHPASSPPPGFLFRAQASVERSVRAFVDRLAGEIERAFGVRFEGARFDPQVEEPADLESAVS